VTNLAYPLICPPARAAGSLTWGSYRRRPSTSYDVRRYATPSSTGWPTARWPSGGCWRGRSWWSRR